MSFHTRLDKSESLTKGCNVKKTDLVTLLSLTVAMAGCGGGSELDGSDEERTALWTGSANGSVIKDANNESYEALADSGQIISSDGTRLNGLTVTNNGSVRLNDAVTGSVVLVSGTGGTSIAAFRCSDGRPLDIARSNGAYRVDCVGIAAAAPAPSIVAAASPGPAAAPAPPPVAAPPSIAAPPEPPPSPAPAPSPSLPEAQQRVDFQEVTAGYFTAPDNPTINEFRVYLRNTGNVRVNCIVNASWRYPVFRLSGGSLDSTGRAEGLILNPGGQGFVRFGMQDVRITDVTYQSRCTKF
jgi:hypothetical protein